MRLNVIDWIALVLTIIGALNWALVVFGFNVVNAIFGAPPALGSVVTYILVGLAGLWLIVLAFRLGGARGIGLNWIDWVALVLVIIGSLNWLLVAFGANLIDAIFGTPPALLSSIIYLLVGLSGLWLIYLTTRLSSARAEI